MSHEASVGVFVKQPIPGKVKTRLAATVGEEAAARLYTVFVEAFLNVIAANVPAVRRVICFHPVTDAARLWAQSIGREFRLHPQTGDGLAARLTDFFESEFSAGAPAVLAVGSDSPNLPVQYILSASAVLQRHDAVIGPATDGGYYLIGLKRVDADVGQLFHGIRWSEAATFSEQVDNLDAAQLSVGMLPPWYDVDTVVDLRLLKDHLTAAAKCAPDSDWESMPHVLESIEKVLGGITTP